MDRVGVIGQRFKSGCQSLSSTLVRVRQENASARRASKLGPGRTERIWHEIGARSSASDRGAVGLGRRCEACYLAPDSYRRERANFATGPGSLDPKPCRARNPGSRRAVPRAWIPQ